MKSVKKGAYSLLASISKQAIDSASKPRSNGNPPCLWLISYEPKVPASVLARRQQQIDAIARHETD